MVQIKRFNSIYSCVVANLASASLSVQEYLNLFHFDSPGELSGLYWHDLERIRKVVGTSLDQRLFDTLLAYTYGLVYSLFLVISMVLLK